MIINAIKKLKFKDTPLILNAPEDLKKEFVELGCSTAFVKKNKSGNTAVFIYNNIELLSFLKNQLKNIEYDSVFWIVYPKLSSTLKSDINRDTIWAAGHELGIDTVTAVSLNETWTALRFRPLEMVGKKK